MQRGPPMFPTCRWRRDSACLDLDRPPCFGRSDAPVRPAIVSEKHVTVPIGRTRSPILEWCLWPPPRLPAFELTFRPMARRRPPRSLPSTPSSLPPRAPINSDLRSPSNADSLGCATADLSSICFFNRMKVPCHWSLPTEADPRHPPSNQWAPMGRASGCG